MRLVATAIITLLAAAANAQDAEGCGDHALVPRPRGAMIVECQHKTFDAFDVPTGLAWGSGELVSEHLEGDVVFVHYSHAASTSQLEVSRTYQAVFGRAGYSLAFQDPTRQTWRTASQGLDTRIVLEIGDSETQVHVIQVKPLSSSPPAIAQPSAAPTPSTAAASASLEARVVALEQALADARSRITQLEQTGATGNDAHISVPGNRGLDPVSWTPTKRGLRCPTWLESRSSGGSVGATPTSSGRTQSAWS